MTARLRVFRAAGLALALATGCATAPPAPAPAPPPPKPKPQKVDMFRYVPPRKVIKTDEDVVREQINEHTNYFTFLYKKNRKINPGLTGKFVVEITIDGQGGVSHCAVVSSSMTDDALEKEVVAFIKKLEFPDVKIGDLTVVYPFVF